MHPGRSTAALALLVLLTLLVGCTPGGPTTGRGPTPSPSGSAAPLDGERPHVVFVLVDDMRADELRWMPHTRKLVGRQGARYTSMISPHPLCCPARAELFTGQYGQNNGVTHNSGPYGGYGAFDPSATVATWAEAAGYSSALLGKYLNRYGNRERPRRDPGWTVFKPLLEPVYAYNEYRFFGDRRRRGYVTNALNKRAVQFVRGWQDDDQPHLLYLSHPGIHNRLTRTAGSGQLPLPAARDRRRFARVTAPVFDNPVYDQRRMAGFPKGWRDRPRVDADRVQQLFLARIRTLQAIDRGVRHLVRELRRTGQLDRTILAVTSDNAMHLGEHRHLQKDQPSRYSMDVPFVVRGPGIEPGTVHRELTTLVDVGTTFSAWMGLDPTLDQDGLPLTEPDALAERDTVLIQTGSPRLQRNATYPEWVWRGVRTERYLFAWQINRPPGQREVLFDLERDPFERRNHARDPRYAAVREELRKRTLELIECSGRDACNRTFGATPPVG